MKRTMFIAVAASGLALAGAPELIRPRGWAPLVHLAGGGDAKRAVESLGLGVKTLHGVLHGLDVDQPTRTFVTGLRESLDDFDLEGFHELLPMKERGQWRRARVTGRLDGKRYLLRQAPASVRAIDPQGPFGARPGDLVAAIGACPTEGAWRLELDAGVGAGAIGWSQVEAAAQETLRLVASGDLRAPGARSEAGARPGEPTRARIARTHPALRPEDVEVLGVLWEAFPALAEVGLTVARVEDLAVSQPPGSAAYQQLRASLKLRPDLMEERYPELAEFLTDLGPLFKADLRWLDDQGRSLARAHLETEQLRLTLEAFVLDGRLLPVGTDGKVVVAAPAAPAGPASRFTCQADLTFNVNGVVTSVRGMVAETVVARGEGGALDVVGRIVRKPQVTVGGRAFGILPTWAVDVVIPGNLEELTNELLGTACEHAWDDGEKGLLLSLRARRAGDAATLSAGGRVAVLDSALIRFGARVAGMKLVPDDETRDELWALLGEVHGAFAKDLAGFAAIVR